MQCAGFQFLRSVGLQLRFIFSMMSKPLQILPGIATAVARDFWVREQYSALFYLEPFGFSITHHPKVNNPFHKVPRVLH